MIMFILIFGWCLRHIWLAWAWNSHLKRTISILHTGKGIKVFVSRCRFKALLYHLNFSQNFSLFCVLDCTLAWWQLWNFIVRQVKFNRFLHPNENPQRIFWKLVWPSDLGLPKKSCSNFLGLKSTLSSSCKFISYSNI